MGQLNLEFDVISVQSKPFELNGEFISADEKSIAQSQLFSVLRSQDLSQLYAIFRNKELNINEGLSYTKITQNCHNHQIYDKQLEIITPMQYVTFFLYFINKSESNDTQRLKAKVFFNSALNLLIDRIPESRLPSNHLPKQGDAFYETRLKLRLFYPEDIKLAESFARQEMLATTFTASSSDIQSGYKPSDADYDDREEENARLWPSKEDWRKSFQQLHQRYR